MSEENNEQDSSSNNENESSKEDYGYFISKSCGSKKRKNRKK